MSQCITIQLHEKSICPDMQKYALTQTRFKLYTNKDIYEVETLDEVIACLLQDLQETYK